MTPRAARAACGTALAAVLSAACAPAEHAAPYTRFPVDWTVIGFEGPLVTTAPADAGWTRRGAWEAHDGRNGAILLGPPMASPPPLPELLAALDPDAVPAALPGGSYRVFEGEDATLWYRRFERTGQACVAFVRTGDAAVDTGAWGYYCAVPGAPLPDIELSAALAAIRWSGW